MRNITIKDFTAGQTAYLVSRTSRYYQEVQKLKITEVPVIKVGRKYIKIQNGFDNKFENAESLYLTLASETKDAWEYKLFRTRTEADEYVERKQLLEEIQRRYRMIDELPIENLRLIATLLQKKEVQESTV